MLPPTSPEAQANASRPLQPPPADRLASFRVNDAFFPRDGHPPGQLVAPSRQPAGCSVCSRLHVSEMVFAQLPANGNPFRHT